MDEEMVVDGFFVFIFIILMSLILIVAIVLKVIDNYYYSSLASEKALEYCQARGYEAYITFNKKLLSGQPLGVICGSSYEKVLYDKGKLINIKR